MPVEYPLLRLRPRTLPEFSPARYGRINDTLQVDRFEHGLLACALASLPNDPRRCLCPVPAKQLGALLFQKLVRGKEVLDLLQPVDVEVGKVVDIVEARIA